MKWGYKTISLPSDFWRSLFINYLESIIKKGRIFPILVTSNMNEYGEKRMHILKEVQEQEGKPTTLA
jgi:hypothetical protein